MKKLSEIEMIFVNANDVLMSEMTSEEKMVNTRHIAVEQPDSGGALSSNGESSASSSGRESVISDRGYISSSSSCDRTRLLSVEEDHNANEYNAVISPCNTSICDVLNDTFIASARNSPVSDVDSTGDSELDQPLAVDVNKKKFEESLCGRAKSIHNDTLHSQETCPRNISLLPENGMYYDPKMDFDMFFDGVLETTYSDLVSNQNISAIFANNASCTTSSSDTASEDSQNSPPDIQLSTKDFGLDEELPFNLHGTCQTLPSLMEFSRNEMTSRSHLCTSNTNFITYQEDGYSSRNKRADSRIFEKPSSTKSGNVLSSTVTGSNSVPISEEEAWRSYLENPLTAATTAMMSIHGDEDSAAALGMLYDYYKVPKEKRLLSYPTSIAELKNRSAISQKSGVNLTMNSTANHRKDELSCTVLSGKSVATLPPRGADDNHYQRLETVSDMMMQPRPAPSTNEAKVKSEIKQTVCDVPQNYTTRALESLPPMSYTSTIKSNYSPAVTIDFSALSTHSTNSYVIAKQCNTSFTDPMEYVMEAPKSLKQKVDDPTMSYINKGQFYAITLRATNIHKLNASKIKSVIHIVFGDQKCEEEQLKHWKYWHARQHTVKQRIIDIADYKESNMIYDVEEISHNAIGFCWNACDTAKIFISCNCLSTDFSAQKGIKGLPLLLQIDTYVDGQELPVHRGQCQIKVFCDKGAERKIRDEERKATRKRQKNSKTNKASSSDNLLPMTELKPAPPSANPSQTGTVPKRLDFVTFKTISDIETRPVLFIPNHSGHSAVSHSIVMSSLSPTAASATPLSPKAAGSIPTSETEQPFVVLPENTQRITTMKRHNTDDVDNATPTKVSRSNDHDRVLLYVRHASEEIYDGLVLETPSLAGLKLSIQEKFGYPSEHIKNVFKKSKRGILVRVDDNIIRHYSNEDTFIIDIRSEAIGDVIKHTVTLMEV